MKVLEQVVKVKIRNKGNIYRIQYKFSPEKCITDAISIVRKMQWRYMLWKKELWLAFVDSEKHLKKFTLTPTSVLYVVPYTTYSTVVGLKVCKV